MRWVVPTPTLTSTFSRLLMRISIVHPNEYASSSEISFLAPSKNLRYKHFFPFNLKKNKTKHFFTITVVCYHVAHSLLLQLFLYFGGSFRQHFFLIFSNKSRCLTLLNGFFLKIHCALLEQEFLM